MPSVAPAAEAIPFLTWDKAGAVAIAMVMVSVLWAIIKKRDKEIAELKSRLYEVEDAQKKFLVNLTLESIKQRNQRNKRGGDK